MSLRIFRLLIVTLMSVAVALLVIAKSLETIRAIDGRDEYFAKISNDINVYFLQDSLAVKMSPVNFGEQLELLRGELGQIDGFLGAHEYFNGVRGVKLIDAKTGVWLYSYEYTEAHKSHGLINIVDGEMIPVDYAEEGEPIPVVATVNSGLSVGDVISLDLMRFDEEIIQVEAYVIGLAEDKFFMPYMPAHWLIPYHHDYESAEPAYIFLPPLDNLRGEYAADKFGFHNTKNLYVVFEEGALAENRDAIAEIIYKYGVIDMTEWLRANGDFFRYEADVLKCEVYDKARPAAVFAAVAVACSALFIFANEIYAFIKFKPKESIKKINAEDQQNQT